MFGQSTAQKPKELTTRTFSNDQALVRDRRKRVVRCSTAVFAKKGHDQSNTHELAKGCSMSDGALYHCSGSKEEVLYSIINSAILRQASPVQDGAHELARASRTTALIEVMKKSYEWQEDNQDVTLFAYQEMKKLPGNSQQSIFDSEARILSVFEKLLTRGAEGGGFGLDDPRLIAHDIVVPGHAWALRCWHLRKRSRFKTRVREQTAPVLQTITEDNKTGVSIMYRKESSQ